MARLIILGNGYDISRLGGITAYKKFGEWLCERYNLSFCSYNKLPFTKNLNSYTGDFYKNVVCDFPPSLATNIDDVRKRFFATMLVNMIQDLHEDSWSCFEDDLGNLPWSKYIEEADNFFKNTSSIGSVVSYGTDFITSSASTIVSLFAEWIAQLRCVPPKKKGFENRLTEIYDNDTIVIFNYTTTFEQIFGLSSADSRVCHIHGVASDESSIIVGHGDSSKNISTSFCSVEDYIHEAESQLYKPTATIIKNTQVIWEKIIKDFSKDCDNEIYVFGWRGYGVDEPYLEKIIDVIKSSNQSCTLFLSDYMGDGSEKEDLWRKKGFVGTINLFDSEEDLETSLDILVTTNQFYSHRPDRQHKGTSEFLTTP